MGTFVHQLREDTWWWSDGLYTIHGFEPDQVVVVSTGLVEAHRHPKDRARVEQAVASAVRDATGFSCYHRVVDARRRTRPVVTVGFAVRSPQGDVREVRGVVVDLAAAGSTYLASTDEPPDHRSPDEEPAAARARHLIMSGYGIDAVPASALLRFVAELDGSSHVEEAELWGTGLDGHDAASPERRFLDRLLLASTRAAVSSPPAT